MKQKDTIKCKGENYILIKEYRDFFLVISEVGFNIKRIAKLTMEHRR